MNVQTNSPCEVDNFFGGNETNDYAGTDKLSAMAARLEAGMAETSLIERLLGNMEMIEFYKITFIDGRSHYCFDVKGRKDLSFSLSGSFENERGVRVICINNHQFHDEMLKDMHRLGFEKKLNALIGLEKKVSKKSADKIYQEAFDALIAIRELK